MLGLEITYKGGGDGDEPDFSGIVQRDGVMIMLQHIRPEILVGALGR